MPLISVIVPCYNQAKYLPVALDSLLAQTISDWECIIVDDGSPDDTASVASNYLERDRRFRYLRKENGGLSSARNFGLKYVEGKFIQFLDSDDFLEPDKFENDFGALGMEVNPSVVICDYCFEGDDGHRWTNKMTAPRFQSNRAVQEIALRWETDLSIPVHTLLIDASLFKRGEFEFDPRLPNHEDWDLWMRLFVLEPGIFFTCKMGAVYRVHSTSMSRNQGLMRKGFKQAIHNQLALFCSDKEIVALLKRKLLMTDDFYGYSFRSWFRDRVVPTAFFRKVLPWPFQKFLIAVSAPTWRETENT